VSADEREQSHGAVSGANSPEQRASAGRVSRPAASATQRHGLLVIDKPAGWTSHDVVGKVRKIYGQRRVGHAGTLDPDATGVLLVGLGRVTRLLRFLQETTKSYSGRIVFGIATDTLDASGAVLERAEMPLSREQVAHAARAFIGESEQMPPMVSALKVQGRRLYELARAGEEVERAPRPVRIDRFDVDKFEPGPYPEATFVVDCSSGTYVRSIAADLGTALGGCAHLAVLRRLRVGDFDISEANAIESIAAHPDVAIRTPRDAMRALESIVVRGDQVRAVSHGATFAARALLPAGAGAGPFAVVDDGGTLLAVYERRGAGVKPAVVLALEAP
jgi:tRNA pseudouridine55 synthase